jgi:uncharacterized membrane protein (DUF106 family)
MVFDSFFNAIFGFIITESPLLGLIVISFVLTLMITIAYKYLTDQELMKNLKLEIKASQEEMKKLKDQPAKMMEVQKKSMEKNFKYMMHSFKPTLYTLIPLLIIFSWLGKTFKEVKLDFLGINSWLWVYIIFSLVFSIVLRKLLKIH